jgi:sensor histidine kinase YesM
MQLIIAPFMIGSCIYEIWRENLHRSVLYSSASLFVLEILEIINISTLWWPKLLLVKIAAIILCSYHLIQGYRYITTNYFKSLQLEHIENDLKNSRIMLSMNQIRTHFVFNIMNAISGMCKYDPEKADNTIVRFARYLRTNIDIMQEDNLVLFQSALQHLEDYIVLEQIRFGDKIRFETDITIEDFLIPPLLLQPVVENAIKYGLNPNPLGGTITLKTIEEVDYIVIEVIDDGIGFDVNQTMKEGSVGLQNVKFRLENLVHGNMLVESKPGEGTKVTMRMPKKEVDICI